MTVNVPCEESEVFEERVRRHDARVQAYEIRLAAYEADVQAIIRNSPRHHPSPTLCGTEYATRKFPGG